MELDWKKINSGCIEAYLGQYHVITILEEGQFFKWYCELPFGTDNYVGREIGKANTLKRAALDATQKVEEWITKANLKPVSP